MNNDYSGTSYRDGTQSLNSNNVKNKSIIVGKNITEALNTLSGTIDAISTGGGSGSGAPPFSGGGQIQVGTGAGTGTLLNIGAAGTHLRSTGSAPAWSNNVDLAPGTLGSLGLKIVGDPNTGLYSPAGDTLAIVANGTTELVIGAGNTTNSNLLQTAGFRIVNNIANKNTLISDGSGNFTAQLPRNLDFRGTNADSVQIGNETTNTGLFGSVSIGNGSTATGDESTATGRLSSATQLQSTAYGSNAFATGVRAVAVGGSTVANSQQATAVGYASQANALQATAVGYGSSVYAPNGTAVGTGNIDIGGEFGIAIGNGANVNYANAVGIGKSAVPDSANSIQLGQATNSTTNAHLKFRSQTIGNETWIDSNVRVATIDATGNIVKSAIDPASIGATTLNGLTDATITTPANKELLAYDTATSQWVNKTLGSIIQTPSLPESVQLGFESTNATDGTVVIGGYAGSTNTIGLNDVIIGNQAGTNNGDGSSRVILGKSSGFANPVGDRGICVGFETRALGVDSIAIGTNTNASQNKAVAIGQGAVCNAQNSFQFGSATNSGTSATAKFRSQTIANEAWIDTNNRIATIDATGNIVKSAIDPATLGTGTLTTLNTQTGASQTFATATTGTDFTISSSANVHTFAIPSAAVGVRGLVTNSGTQTFDGVKVFNQTPRLTTNLIQTSGLNTLTLPTTADTLVGRATTDTLTNKTLTAPVISTITNTGTITLPTTTDTLVGRATTDTLTNKTMTGATNTLTAKLLKTATTEVNIASATAPSANQVLMATNSTTASWQTLPASINVVPGYLTGHTLISEGSATFTGGPFTLTTTTMTPAQFWTTGIAVGGYRIVGTLIGACTASTSTKTLNLFLTAGTAPTVRVCYNNTVGGLITLDANGVAISSVIPNDTGIFMVPIDVYIYVTSVTPTPAIGIRMCTAAGTFTFTNTNSQLRVYDLN